MNLILIDGPEWDNLRPLTLTKPFGELRMGIMTFRERWMKVLGRTEASYLTRDYLSEKYPRVIETDNLFLNPSFFPSNDLAKALKNLPKGNSLWYKGELIGGRFETVEEFEDTGSHHKSDFKSPAVHIRHLWDLFLYNGFAIGYDFHLITSGRKSTALSSTNQVIGGTSIFLEEGAEVEHCILNDTEGPIYLGRNAKVAEGCMIRGSFALCDEAQLKMGAKIYPGTTVGYYCKAGGEINNSILMNFSNKGHDGFLGNSVVGDWCNMGAGTNNSNLKNNYSNVRLWNESKAAMEDTGLQFCGLFMGDYSKSAIGTRFNTGTVIGVSANVFTSEFPPKHIPSFSWGGRKDSPRYDLGKSFEAASRMMSRRKIDLTDKDKAILTEIFKH